MKPIPILLSRCTVVTVRFTDANHYEADLCHLHYSREEMSILEHTAHADVTQETPLLKKFPVIVLFCGHGVITKSDDTASELLTRVMNAHEKFYWSRHEPANTFEADTQTTGAVSFAARSQVDPVREELQKYIPFWASTQYIPCAKDTQIPQTAAEYAREFYREQVTLRSILKPSDCGSLLAGQLARRLRLPVLAFLLLLLAGSHRLNERLQAKSQAVQQQLTLLQESAGRQTVESEQKREILAGFNRTFGCKYGLLCDRIARHVPLEVILTSLAIQPLTKPIADRTPLTLVEHTVRIAGQARTADEISAFSKALAGETCFREVVLGAAEQNRKTGLFSFQIEIRL